MVLRGRAGVLQLLLLLLLVRRFYCPSPKGTFPAKTSLGGALWLINLVLPHQYPRRAVHSILRLPNEEQSSLRVRVLKLQCPEQQLAHHLEMRRIFVNKSLLLVRHRHRILPLFCPFKLSCRLTCVVTVGLWKVPQLALRTTSRTIDRPLVTTIELQRSSARRHSQFSYFHRKREDIDKSGSIVMTVHLIGPMCQSLELPPFVLVGDGVVSTTVVLDGC